MGLYVTCDLSMTSWVVVKLELTYEQTDMIENITFLQIILNCRSRVGLDNT